MSVSFTEALFLCTDRRITGQDCFFGFAGPCTGPVADIREIFADSAFFYAGTHSDNRSSHERQFVKTEPGQSGIGKGPILRQMELYPGATGCEI